MLLQLGQGYQNFYDGVCHRLNDQDLDNLSKASSKGAAIVQRYDLSGRVSNIFAIPRDFLEGMCSFYGNLSGELSIRNSFRHEEVKKNLALSTNPSVVLNRLTQLPNSPSRQTLLLKTSHIILDPKTKYWYFRINRMAFSVLNTGHKIISSASENNPNIDPNEIITSYVTELSKKEDQKRIPNQCIEDVIFSILSMQHGGRPPPAEEEAIRGLIQFEIAKIEPEGDKNFDQTIDEFAGILAQTFKDVEPLYNTLINLDTEIKAAPPAPAPAPANHRIHQIIEQNHEYDLVYIRLILILSATVLSMFIYDRFFNARV